jgi:hypothetical protein
MKIRKKEIRKQLAGFNFAAEHLMIKLKNLIVKKNISRNKGCTRTNYPNET